MALTFESHPDVVFGKAPLTQVLCQIRFPPILALFDAAGLTGFQEALRRDYPEFDVAQQAEISVSPNRAEVQNRAPVWRLHDGDDRWQVSIAVDFVALEVKSYGHFAEFSDRLVDVIAALERTLSPGRSKRVGLRKVNQLTHPDVETPSDWASLLRNELLGLVGDGALPGEIVTDYSELHLRDADRGVLSIRHGVAPDTMTAYRLDLDYWTERSMTIKPDESFGVLLKAYSDSMTAFFHSCLNPIMYDFLDPIPRSEVVE